MEFSEQLEEILLKYSNNIQGNLKNRWNAWEKDLTIPEKYEVIGGLMARQITIANNFISCSSIWNGHIAPIILRSLIDNFINFAWILEDPLIRTQKFIYYGLGQEKLLLEHRKSQLSDESDENDKLMIEAQEQWINAQRFTFLTEVNLQNWAGISARQMAQEANILDIYNFAYQPFSVCVHSMWNHISKYNLVISRNPFHKYFKKPAILSIEPSMYYVELTAMYVHKMFRLFDKKNDYIPSNEYSYIILLKDLDNLALQFSDESDDEKL